MKDMTPFPFRRTVRLGTFAVLACAFLFSGIALGAPRTQGGAEKVKPLYSQKKGWRLVQQFSDEFNGAELDTAKWDNDVPDWGVWSWEPENAWVSNGKLNIRMEYSEHMRGWQKLYYTSGIVKSKAPPIRYGYFEARIKAASRYPGVAPAFWAYRQDPAEWTEIDFVELTQRNKDVRWIDTDTHVFKQPFFPGPLPLQEVRTWVSPWDPRDAFHVYGCEWDAKEIKWYVDGKLIQKRRNDYWHQALDVVLSMGVRGELKYTPSMEGFPTTFETDYIRVWSLN